MLLGGYGFCYLTDKMIERQSVISVTYLPNQEGIVVSGMKGQYAGISQSICTIIKISLT